MIVGERVMVVDLSGFRYLLVLAIIPTILGP